jgi:perosamine synthetase
LSRTTTRIPLSRPYLGEREEELVLDVLRSGRLSLGPTIERFEELIAERTGAPHAVALSSGTAGLHLLARIAGLGPGDEVITSTFSFVASANCFVVEGATPVFADIDARTLNFDPDAVEAAVTERTKAIVAVDIFGYPCELDELRAIADRHGLVLIDDSCEALGAEYKGQPLGSHGPSSVFAFYPNKQVAAGEGGVVTTHSEDEAKMLRSLRNQGRSYEGGRWFHHPYLGLNYRWTDLQAAVGLAQLEKLDEILELRSAAAARYAELLADVDGVTLPAPDDEEHVRSWFVYVVLLDEGVDRSGVAGAARRRGDRVRRIPAVHPPPAVHARGVRLRRGPLPGCGGREPADARAAVLPGPRAGRSGARGGSARRGARQVTLCHLL